MNIIAMGTGGFALPMLLAMTKSHHCVDTLITQPPRLAPGRRKHTHSAIKQHAIDSQIEVMEPDRINHPEQMDLLLQRRPDVLVVAAYGQILAPEILRIPRKCAINLHASLLPRYRGAAPVNWAIYHGERETGVTVIEMNPEIDEGPILEIERTAIKPYETAGELTIRLAEIGAALILKVLDDLESNCCTPIPQDSKLATRAPRLKKTDGYIDWTRSAEQVSNQIRAMQPWPKAVTNWRRKTEDITPLILLDAHALREQRTTSPGSVQITTDGKIEIQTGQGTLVITRLQIPGKKPLETTDFLRGNPLETGDLFEHPLKPA